VVRCGHSTDSGASMTIARAAARTSPVCISNSFNLFASVKQLTGRVDALGNLGLAYPKVDAAMPRGPRGEKWAWTLRATGRSDHRPPRSDPAVPHPRWGQTVGVESLISSRKPVRFENREVRRDFW
jgi:hypothetical protein